MASSTVQPIVPPITTTPTTTTANQNEIPVTVVSNLPPQPQTQTQTSSLSNNNSFNPKKRSIDQLYALQCSPYFKMRAILNDLRPLFIQVLRAPDFQNCEAASRIQKKMKLMIDICRQHIENPPLAKCNSAAGSLDFTSEKLGWCGQISEPPQEKRFPVGNNLEKPVHGSTRIPGTYIVGGSAFGWNFITFHGTKPEYYGRTKESFRAGK